MKPCRSPCMAISGLLIILIAGAGGCASLDRGIQITGEGCDVLTVNKKTVEKVVKTPGG